MLTGGQASSVGMSDIPGPVSDGAIRCARRLVLEFFRIWRGQHDAVDALILLAITRSNVDGIVYSRELRKRFGGVNSVAPDDLRQEVSLEILAQSLRMPIGRVRRRVRVLASRDECVITPTGMLITHRQVANSDRLRIVGDVYELLRRSYRDLKRLGLFDAIPLPPFEPAADPPPVRSAAAHGAKCVLRVVGEIAPHLGDCVDAIIVLRLLETGAGRRTVREAAAALGLSRSNVQRRIARLLSDQVCERIGRGVVACRADAAWLEAVETRTFDHIFQLFAGLAEVGALDDFERATS